MGVTALPLVELGAPEHRGGITMVTTSARRTGELRKRSDGRRTASSTL